MKIRPVFSEIRGKSWKDALSRSVEESFKNSLMRLQMSMTSEL